MDVHLAQAAAGARTQGLLTARALRAAGLQGATVTRLLAAGEIVRVRRQVYARSSLPPLPRYVVTGQGVDPVYVAHVRAVLLSLGDRATACGRTAAALYRWGLLVEPSHTIGVSVPHGFARTSPPGVRITQRRKLARIRHRVLPGTDAVWVCGPVQTVLDCCATLPVLEAVVVCDSALRAGHVTLRELQIAARTAQARRAVSLADPESASVLESVLRVRMLLAGLSGFATQVVLCATDGTYLRRVDFCFAIARVVVEVDGARWHPDPHLDRSVDNALTAAGFRVLRYTWADVVHDHERVLEQIRVAVRVGAATRRAT